LLLCSVSTVTLSKKIAIYKAKFLIVQYCTWRLDINLKTATKLEFFANLTNTYCLTAFGGSENFYSVFENELPPKFPTVKASIAGTRLVGRMTVGKVCILQKEIPPRTFFKVTKMGYCFQIQLQIKRLHI